MEIIALEIYLQNVRALKITKIICFFRSIKKTIFCSDIFLHDLQSNNLIGSINFDLNPELLKERAALIS